MKCADCAKTAIGSEANRPYCEEHFPESRATADGTLAECPRCGQEHEGLIYKPFTRPTGLLHEWAPCPVNGEPILVTIQPAQL